MFKLIEPDDDLVAYALAEGTPAEREFKLSPSLMGQQWDSTFKWMLNLQAQIAAGNRDAAPYRPMLPFITAYWVIWQYVAHDISALRSENAALRDEIAELRERMRGDRADSRRELEESYAMLSARIDRIGGKNP